MSSTPADHPDATLVRAIGVRTLAASIVNTTVGAGIFVLPAAVADRIGAAAPLAYLVCALTMALIVTCFAMAGSRVSATGGVYAYVETAFGPFAGFLTGVLFWLTASTACAGVASALAGSVGQLVPVLGVGVGRAVFLAGVYGGLALANIRGVRTGARLVEVVTVAKLAPLLVLVATGIFFVKPSFLAWPGMPASAALGDTVLLLIFAFVGIEVALVPSGEVRDPERTVPRAIYLALAATTLLYMAVQFVAHGILGSELGHLADAPLAHASARAIGEAGRVLVLAGATVSMFGYVSGDMLATPRLVFALGRDGFLPAAFRRVHPRHRTPAVAIAVYAAVICVFAVAGSFRQLAIIANVAVLTLYFVCCAAAWELNRRDVRTGARPFRIPAGSVVPFLACGTIAWILAHATRREFTLLGGVLGMAALLYLFKRPTGR
jgi:basic amino acid/polyamine antiporter, APA family